MTVKCYKMAAQWRHRFILRDEHQNLTMKKTQPTSRYRCENTHDALVIHSLRPHSEVLWPTRCPDYFSRADIYIDGGLQVSIQCHTNDTVQYRLCLVR